MSSIQKIKQLHSAGNIDKAIKLSSQLLKKNPNNYQLLHTHATLHNQAGIVKTALKSYLKLYTLNKADINIILTIGTCFSKTGEYQSSLNYFLKALNIRPDDPEIIMNIGVLYRLLNQTQESTTYLEKAVQLAPKNAESFHNLAITNELEEDYDTALSNYRHALNIDNQHYRALGNMGVVYSKIKDLDKAEEAFLASLSINPKYDLSLKNLGINYVHQKKLDEAKALLFKAISYHPNNGIFYNNIAQLSNLNLEELNNIKKNILDVLKTPDHKIFIEQIYFALAKICLSLKEYKVSENSYLKANTIVNKIKPFNRSFVNKYFEYSKHLISHLSSSYNSEHTGENFLFIIGMPRSGTTLLESLLSMHNQLTPGDELPFMNYICFKELLINDNYILPIPEKNLSNIAEYYVSKTLNLVPKKGKLIDKLPHNFRWVPVIKAIFPKANIIHISRDPIDNCWSLFKENFNYHSHEYSYRLDLLGEYYAKYQQLMSLYNANDNYNIIDVKYEDIVDNPVGITKSIFNRIGINPEDFNEGDRDSTYYSKTASSVQVQQPIYKKSVQGWRKHSEFLKPIIFNLQKHQNKLGLPIYDDKS